MTVKIVHYHPDPRILLIPPGAGFPVLQRVCHVAGFRPGIIFGNRIPGMFYQPGHNQFQIPPDAEHLPRVLGRGSDGIFVQLFKIRQHTCLLTDFGDCLNMKIIGQKISRFHLCGKPKPDTVELKVIP